MSNRAVSRAISGTVEPLEPRRLLAAQLVRDLNPMTQDSNPDSYVQVGGRVFFLATTVAHGRELWVSDGTTAGTQLTRDIKPGPQDSGVALMTAAGDRLYFVADDGTHHRELWVSDGTPAGTHLVKDLLPGWTSDPRPNFVAGTTLYFTAQERLFRTDGTAEGTVPMTPTTMRVSSAVLERGGWVYFVGTLPGADWEPWRTNGTTTERIADVYSGSIGSQSQQFVDVNGTIFFSATTSQHGTELWATDGTAANTRLVRDIRPGDISSNPFYLRRVGDSLYFVANDGTNGAEIWKSDGTTAGTVMVANIDANPTELTAWGEALYFVGTTTAHGTELWKTDGTGPGTRVVRDIVTGPTGSNPSFLRVVNGQFYFLANGGAGLSGTWRTDGSEGGTQYIGGIHPAAQRFGNGLFLTNGFDVHGREPWVVDQFRTSEALLRDVNDAPSDSTPERFLTVGGYTFFNARTANNLTPQMHRTDGTAAGTTAIVDALGRRIAMAFPPAAAQLGDALIFSGVEANSGDQELWRTDGTPAGTYRLADLFPGFPSSAIRSMHRHGNYVYFNADDAAGLRSFYRTDGTAAGTVRLVVRGSQQEVRPLGGIGDYFYFASSGPTGSDWELWRTDGTPAGSVLFKDLVTTRSSSPSNGLVVGNLLYFAASDGGNNFDGLWRTDGTDAGTFLVQPSGGTSSTLLGQRVEFKGELYYSRGYQLWKTGGTPQTTVQYAELPFGGGTGAVTPMDDVLLFVADSAWGVELWKTDGTATGTGVVKDIRPGNAGSQPNVLGVAGHVAFLSADDGVNGRKIWRTDGSADGTFLDSRNVANYEFNPYYFAVLTGALLFAGVDAQAGVELHKVDALAAVDDAGALRVSGTPGADQIAVSAAGGNVVVSSAGRSLSFPAVDVSSVVVSGFGGDDVITVTAAANLPLHVIDPAGADTLAVAAGASVFFNASLKLGALNLAGAATMDAAGNRTLVVGDLSVAPGGRLDLRDNAMVWDYAGLASPAAQLRQWLLAGRGAAAGVYSSLANASPETRTLGYGEAAQLYSSFPAAFAGQTVDATSLLVRYTTPGDANLDRAVALPDFNLLAAHFGQSNRTYAQGDFNYDGVVNLRDFNLLAARFGAPFAPATAVAALDDNEDD